jgi:AAA domain
MTLPATAAERSLDDRLRESPEPVPFHIDDLARRHHNVVVAAQYKTGKTTLAVERVRAEVDGLPFLDSFATQRIDGNVGFWNNELETSDMDDYFSDLGIATRQKVKVEDFKGFRVPLLHDVGAEWAIKWLTEREVESWYIDPWRAICSWSKVSEYLDPEVARWSSASTRSSARPASPTCTSTTTAAPTTWPARVVGRRSPTGPMRSGPTSASLDTGT